jgi:hypothetical protein
MKREDDNPKRFSLPGIIYITWTGLLLFFVFVIIPIANIGHSGGEQIPLTLFAYAISFAIVGYFIISILTSIIFDKWIKKYWILNLLVFLITGGIIIRFLLF